MFRKVEEETILDKNGVVVSSEKYYPNYKTIFGVVGTLLGIGIVGYFLSQLKELSRPTYNRGKLPYFPSKKE